MSFVPSAAAQNIATQAGSNEASLASPLTALQTSITGGNLAPAAFIDAIRSGIGYQAQQDVQCVNTASPTQHSQTYGDIGDNGVTGGFPTWTVTVPLANPYLVHVDTDGFMTVAADAIWFRIVDGASTVLATADSLFSMRFYYNTLTQHARISFRVPITFTAGSHTLKLQWKVRDGVGTAKMDDGSFRAFTITG